MTSRALETATLALVLAASPACTSLATGPEWTHESLAGSAPDRVKAEDAELKREAIARAREPKQIGAKHVLVMHDKSERKPEGVHRTREEARKRAEECYERIKAGANFDEMVAIYSDEPAATSRPGGPGSLGVFEKKDMVHSFAEAAFALEIGQVSEVVETPFGFHIIKRTE